MVIGILRNTVGTPNYFIELFDRIGIIALLIVA